VSAARGLAVGESPLASPELALVDAALAAELRLSLRPVEDSWLRAPARFEQAPAAFVEDARGQWDPADEVGEAESGDADQLHDDDYIVEAVDEYIVDEIEHPPVARSERMSSQYPVLPAPEPYEEVIEETDAALRQIRERMTDESPASERKLRRGFILGSGASAMCALGVLAVDLQFHVAQLPGWLGS
jgi:hypothetical protein